MAVYHFDVSSVSRRLGQCAVAAWAYISGTRQVDERTGRVYDYAHKARDVLAKGSFGPTNWQACERAEKRWDSKVARTIIVALPCELDLAAQISLLCKLARGLREQHGVACGWAVHAAPKDARNRHGHLLITTRRVDDAGNYEAKTRELDVRPTSARVLTHWRGRWALLVNGALLMARSRSSQVSRRSLAARGITRPARMHMGPERTKQQRQGYRTAAAKHNAAVDEIERANKAIARVNRQISILVARRRRVRVEHQIKQGCRRRWRQRTAPAAVMPESMATNQQAASSIISTPKPAASTPKKPTHRR